MNLDYSRIKIDIDKDGNLLEQRMENISGRELAFMALCLMDMTISCFEEQGAFNTVAALKVAIVDTAEERNKLLSKWFNRMKDHDDMAKEKENNK